MHSADDRRHAALAIGNTAIRAVAPDHLLRGVIHATESELNVCDEHIRWSEIDRLLVIGAGKAAARMAQSVESLLGRRIHSGIVVTMDGHDAVTERIGVRFASHPVPDRRGVDAGAEIIALAESASERDVVIVLLSGGGSALLVSPASGISLYDKQETTRALLASGASIDEINTVRKHLSAVKGGQLARACSPARVITLAISDVQGDLPDVIASGPTVADPSSFTDAEQIILRRGIKSSLPDSVLARIADGVAGKTPETPKQGDALFEHCSYHVIGSNETALQAAADEAVRLGYSPRILTSTFRGEASQAALAVCALAEGVSHSERPVALILGGETTVTLGDSPGRGGRNQELALAAAIALHNRDGITVMSLGTDGTDGPTDAAGGIADGGTVTRGTAHGLSAPDHLTRHDAYPYLNSTGGLIVTGPTGTNVMDLIVALVT